MCSSDLCHSDFLPSLLSPSTVWPTSLSIFLLCSTSCSLELTDRQALSPQALHNNLESSAQLGVMFTMTLALTLPFTPHPSPFFSSASSLPVPPGDQYGPLSPGSSHCSIINYPWLVWFPRWGGSCTGYESDAQGMAGAGLDTWKGPRQTCDDWMMHIYVYFSFCIYIF